MYSILNLNKKDEEDVSVYQLKSENNITSSRLAILLLCDYYTEEDCPGDDGYTNL